MSVKLDVLAIGAHPDDIELACAGTVAKLTRQGKKVGILDLTRGDMGTRGTPDVRMKEAAAASKILGLSVRENLNLPDGKFVLCEDNLISIVRVIRTYRPEILLIPHWRERHPDHERTHRLAREAWFYSGLTKYLVKKEDGSFLEAYRPKAFFHYMQKYEFEPSFIVDISDSHEVRVEAMKTYKSQFYAPDSDEPETLLSKPDFLEIIELRARYYGDRIGVRYGEPFFSIEPIGINNIFNLVF